MKRLAALLVLSLSGALAACGFQPVYANAAGKASAGQIQVSEINGRSGYMLRRALQRELGPGLPGIDGAATLEIDLDEDLTRLTFTPDGAASRANVIAKGDYVLTYGDETLKGNVDAETSFAVPDQPFGDIAAQSSASDRAMADLARKVVDDLRLQLLAGQKK